MQTKLVNYPKFKDGLTKLFDIAVLHKIIPEKYSGEIIVKFNQGGILYVEIIQEKIILK